jgi:hypothetical protein
LASIYLSTKIISLILVCLKQIYIYINKYCIPTWLKQNRAFDACATKVFLSELYEVKTLYYDLMFSKSGNYRQGFSSQSLHKRFAYRLTTDKLLKVAHLPVQCYVSALGLKLSMRPPAVMLFTQRKMLTVCEWQCKLHRDL